MRSTRQTVRKYGSWHWGGRSRFCSFARTRTTQQKRPNQFNCQGHGHFRKSETHIVTCDEITMITNGLPHCLRRSALHQLQRPSYMHRFSLHLPPLKLGPRRLIPLSKVGWFPRVAFLSMQISHCLNCVHWLQWGRTVLLIAGEDFC